MSNLLLTPFVNVDVKMPKSMLEALSTHEAHCVWTRTKSVTEDEVKAFLAQHFTQRLADKFKPEFLFSSQAT